MAIIRLDCNLNGGDSVTPNNELFYRIYGDVDNYAAPIHTTGTALSDANVTVDNDKVIITGVDGTTNTSFKIAAVDGAGNQGILSDAYSHSIDWGLSFSNLPSQRVLGALSVPAQSSDGGNVTIEARVKFNAGGNQIGLVLGVGSVAITQAQTGIYFSSAGNGLDMTFTVGDGTNYETSSFSIPDYTAYHTYKIVALANGTFEWFIDDVSQETGVTPLAQLPAVMDNVYIGQAGLDHASVYSTNGIIDWCKVNGETFDLNEGTGITSVSDEGTTVTLSNPQGGALPQWEQI